MLVHIYDTLSVSDLQERFSNCFQHLKIEFYKRPFSGKMQSTNKYIIDANEKISEVRTNHKEGDLEIKSWYTAERVKEVFENMFGLHVQVFRLEYNNWVSALSTDNIPLSQHMEIAGQNQNSNSSMTENQLTEFAYLIL